MMKSIKCACGCTEFVESKSTGNCSGCHHPKAAHLRKCGTCSGDKTVRITCGTCKGNGRIECTHEDKDDRPRQIRLEHSSWNGEGHYFASADAHTRWSTKIIVCDRCDCYSDKKKGTVECKGCNGNGNVTIACTNCVSGWVTL